MLINAGPPFEGEAKNVNKCWPPFEGEAKMLINAGPPLKGRQIAILVMHYAFQTLRKL